MNTFIRLVKLISPRWKEVGIAVLLGAATMLSNVALIATSAYLISMAALQPSVASLQVAIVGVRFFGISRGVFRYLERLRSHELNLSILGRFHSWFYRAIEPLAPAALSRYSSGDLLSRVIGDVDNLKDFYVRVLAPPLVAIVTAAVWGIYLGLIDKTLMIVLVSVQIVVGLGVPWFVQLLNHKAAGKAVALHQQLSELWVSGIQGMTDILVYNRQSAKQQEFETVIGRVSDIEFQLAAVSALRSSLSTMLANAAMWLVLVLAIPLVNSGPLTGVMLAVVTLGSLASFEAIFPLPMAADHLQGSLDSAARVFEVIDTPPLVTEPGSPLGLGSEISLEITGLNFVYPGSSLPVLKDINLELGRGKKVAVVGPSGAGKTTLINLILRYWPVSAGEIRLNGKSIEKYSGDDIRKQLSVISQNTYLLSGTIRHNLLLARPGVTEAQMMAALESAALADFIATLPAGLDTWIGEHGKQLSAGQRQRLSLARTFLRNDSIVLLDEPTVNLDSVTEAELLSALFSWSEDRTVLLVTHRLVGLDKMDEILVLDRGEVVQHGSEKELLSVDGLYKSMWSSQNRFLIES